jgi:acylglycerol lipase
MIQNSFFKEAFDGRKMFVKTWQSEKTQMANVIIIHGLGEHIGRYEHMANYYTNAGLNVIAIDTFGHGKTEGTRGHTSNMNDYLWQIDKIIMIANELFPNLKTFLYGHSMGGLLVLNYLFKNKPNVAGVIATAPAIKPGTEVSRFKLFLGKFGRKFMPALTQPNGLDLKYLCYDKEVIANYVADPLVHNKISAEVGMGLLEWGDWLELNATETKIPLLIMHGADDKITDFKASENFANMLKGKVIFKKWDNMVHEIHNEKGKKDVYQFAIDWILKH